LHRFALLKVIAFPSLLFLIFIYWVILVFTLKCLGKDRVGFLSGYEFWQEDEYFKEELEHSKCVRKYPRSAYVRMIFIFCGALILLFSLLLASEGVHNIEKTIGSIEKTMLVSLNNFPLHILDTNQYASSQRNIGTARYFE